MRFQEKNVFVTGAGSGFGRATALGFAREGAANVYLVDRLHDRLEAVAAQVEESGAGLVSLAQLMAVERLRRGMVVRCG